MLLPAKTDGSLKLLIATNIITIALALFFNWELMTLLWIYWVQSVIIGFFTAVKMLLFRSPEQKNIETLQLFYAGFFVVHYGLFHFVYMMFLGFFSIILMVTRQPIDLLVATRQPIDLISIFLTSLLFLINHTYSFYLNYLKKKPSDFEQYKNIKDIMLQPYSRIIPMHITIILGGFLIFAIPFASKILLLFFLVLKSAADIYSHVKEHG